MMQRNELAGQIGSVFLEKLQRSDGNLRVSVVIPMYNEEKTIAHVLSSIPRLPNMEIIVIDDGSVDRSREIVKQFSDVKLLINRKNMGYGKTLLRGIFAATGDIIVIMDSDGQHHPPDIPNLIKPILRNECDIVVGSRYKGVYHYRLPLSTRLGEAFIEVLLKILFNIGVKNNQSGFRAFKKETIRVLFGDIQGMGYEFSTETLIKAKVHGFSIKEAPIKLYNRKYGKSRIHLTKLLFSLISCISYYAVMKYMGPTALKLFTRIFEKLGLAKFYRNTKK